MRRLTSETIEDSYSRVEWTNPKDGKVYNLLKQGETEDGKVIVRILDEEGAYVKDAQLTPKKICIVDTFESTKNEQIPHGVFVRTYAKRNNPFAIIDIKNVGAALENGSAPCSFLDVLKEVDNCDYLSLSIASKFNAPRTNFSILYAEMEKFKKTPAGSNVQRWDDILKVIRERGIRILQAANNSGQNSINMTLGKNAEWVGALSPNGKIAIYSGSRDSGLTQHYELGTFHPKEVYIDGKLSGYNITGTRGIDIPMQDIEMIMETSKNEVNQLSKELEMMLQRENELSAELDRINTLIREEQLNSPFEGYLKNCRIIEKKYETIKKPLEEEKSGIGNVIFWSKITIEEAIQRLKNVTPESILSENNLLGTSLSTPIRAAKLALNDMMEGVL